MPINNQSGVSLTELMLSLALSSFLMTALLQHYIGVKRHYNDVQQRLDQHFELQLVSELIRDSVRMAGFAPCTGIDRLTVRDSRSGQFSPAAITVEGGPFPALKLARMSEHFSVVIKYLSPTRLLLEDNKVYDRRYPVMVADCFHAEVLQIANSQTTGEGQLVTLQKPLRFDYRPPFYLGEWLEERFFIGKNREGKPALFYEANDREELTAYITRLAAKRITIKSNILVQVNLGLAKGKSVLIETTVRTPQQTVQIPFSLHSGRRWSQGQ